MSNISIERMCIFLMLTGFTIILPDLTTFYQLNPQILSNSNTAKKKKQKMLIFINI